ncbi:TonB-dependent receptor [Massilia terrae]|uniref:TonB-dependent receptor n=1 Tax=Massilia terrae TaxID=1811224 RepID=A0ABT2CT76_9BURK|nr:TonB-dependent receptor [Massilia terrae]MCS0657181.1 TonB-dependent receptor [Massilia terrae]
MKNPRSGIAMFRTKPIALAVLAVLHGIPAFAQEAAPPVERVEITGSKIKGVDMESSVPIQTITRVQIEATGATSLDEVLQTLAVSGDARNRTAGADQNSFANLRGIGFGRTLVLVNGHRWVGSSDLNGSVDLSSIPLASVQRIDVLKDGGSVLYGADAMVGLINVVLKDHFDGVEARAYYGDYQHGGGAQKKVELTAGHSGERFSSMISLQFNDGDGLHNSDYALTRQRSPAGSGYTNNTDNTPAGRFQLCKGALLASGGCAAGTLADPTGNKNNFITYDTPYNPALGAAGNNWRTYNRPTDSYNNQVFNSLLVPLLQKSVVGDLSYRFTDHMKLRVTAQFMDVDANSDAAPNDLNLGPGGLANGTGIFISPNSYYNPFGVPVGRIQRAGTELGAATRVANTKTTAISPVLSGDFSFANRNFDWEAGMEYGATRQHANRLNEVSSSRLTNALGPSFKDANGNIVCGTPGQVIAGCVPANLLGAGTLTPAMLNYIRLNPSEVGWTNDFRDHDYFVQMSSANLYELPAGSLGFASGFERHIEYGSTVRSAAYDQVDVLSGTRGNTDGGFGSKDAYAEFYVPVLKDKPFIKMLDLSVAFRHSKYDSGASVNNKQFGLKWKVIDDLALRGSYSTGYRLDLSGIIQNTATSAITVTDPCSFTTNTNGTVASNRYAQLTAAQQAQCQAAGVPAGGYDTRTAIPAQATQLNTGNQQLGPERDIFRTFGFVYSPHYAKGLDVTVDYWDVIFRDSILKPNANQMVLNCLSNPGDPRLCPDGWLQRNANGVVTNLRTSALNGPGGERFKGVDVSLRYRPKTTPWGKFGIELNNSILTEVIDTPATPVDKVGVFTTATTSSGSHYRLRSNLNVDWARGNWSARWGARYFSSQTENCTLTGSAYASVCNDLGPVQSQSDPNNPATAKYLPFLGGGSANRIPAYTLHDISVAYTPAPKSRIKFGVNNAFNKTPPLAINSNRSFPLNFGMPDRFFYMEYTQKF